MLKDHPTIKWFNDHQSKPAPIKNVKRIDLAELKALAIKAGADDSGVACIRSAELEEEKDDILKLYAETKALVSITIKLNRENVRCISRDVSDLAFMQGIEQANAVAKKLAVLLKPYGINALYPSAGFPMDISRWPGKMWSVSHKTVAVAAGMGHLGHNRLLIHPDFGNFIILETLLIDRELSAYDTPLGYNPCIQCGLCVSACPVGAISPNGDFLFINCMTHNYRDRLGGFSDWVENIVNSKNIKDYRHKVADTQTISMWQSLSYGICNKSSYCMAVCPAGKNNIGQYLADKKGYQEDIVKPLREKNETIFVLPGSDAQDYVLKNYPHKNIKKVGSGVRPSTIESFMDSLGLIFQKGKSKGLKATYHFRFTGAEHVEATVDIRDMKLAVENRLVGKADITIIADSKTWLGFLAKEKSLILALSLRKIKIKGSPALMKAFARCFPL